MCSSVQEEEWVAPPPQGEVECTKDLCLVEGKCMKCGAEAVTVARTKDKFCKECFYTYFAHRFRAMFGKSKLVRSGDKVLVAFSGGLNSTVLLSLVKDGLSKSTHKKLRFIPSVLVINEETVAGSHQSYSKILHSAAGMGFPVYLIGLEEVFGNYDVHKLEDDSGCLDTRSESSLPSSASASVLEKNLHVIRDKPELKQKLKDLLESAKTLTAKENLLSSLRHRVMTQVAKNLGFSKILVGDSATQLAVRLLANVSQGRGAVVSLDVGFADDRDVTVLRPLREFPEEEVEAFAKLFQLERSDTTQVETENSILQLTGKFVRGLQSQFPSTVNTIFRTGDKLDVASEPSRSSLKCSLCKAPLTASAVEDSSSSPFLNPLQASDPCQSGSDCANHLCYGCLLTVKDMNYQTEYLPPFALHTTIATPVPKQNERTLGLDLEES